MTCRCGKTDDAPTKVKERATGAVFDLCMDCLVDLCLDGGMMHPNPRYAYTTEKRTQDA